MVQARIVEEGPALAVQPWPSERPLWRLVLFTSLAVWLGLVLSVIGLVYVLTIGLIFFLGQVIFIAHLRGSAVRLGPDQLPELYHRVRDIAMRLGMRRTPDIYVLQAGGALNALATRFF